MYAQSPWTKEAKHGYLQFSFNAISNYNSLYAGGTKTEKLQRHLDDNTLQLYGKYGITDRLTLKAVLPMKIQRSGELTSSGFIRSPFLDLSSGSFTSLGNIEIGGKYNFLSKPILISGDLSIQLPVESFQKETGLNGGYNAFTFLPSISIGYGHNRFYIFTALGTAFRTNKYSNYLRWETEGGVRIYKKIYIAFHLINVTSYKDGNIELPFEQQLTGLYVNDQEFFTGTLKLIIGFSKHWGINMSTTSGLISADKVAQSPARNIGLYYEW